MNLVLGFAPFIVFATLTRLSVNVALWVAFATAFVIAIRDFVETRSLKMLDTGSLALFGLMALYAGFIQPDISFGAVRLIIDLGFLLMICGSLARRQPFSLQYAREATAQQYWPEREFLRTNYFVTAVWAIAFLIMTAADAVLAFDTRFPVLISVAAGLLSLIGALVFTLRYPAKIARRRNMS